MNAHGDPGHWMYPQPDPSMPNDTETPWVEGLFLLILIVMIVVGACDRIADDPPGANAADCECVDPQR